MHADFHTHTRFSDGRHSAEEMVRAAIEKGMYGIGFSDHSPMPFECGWCIREEWMKDYAAEAKRLKSVYGDRITVLAGLELDLHSEMPTEALDYMILSSHFVKNGDDYLPVDCTAEIIQKAVDEHYGGNIFGFCRDYYEQLASLADRGCAVIGHFDLVTKFNEGGCMFDESDPRYRNAAMEALEVLAAKDMVFEINTGAVFRGHRTDPYPAIPLLRRMKQLGCRVILSGDSHNIDALCHKFDEAREYAALAGYTEFEKSPPLRR